MSVNRRARHAAEIYESCPYLASVTRFTGWRVSEGAHDTHENRACFSFLLHVQSLAQALADEVERQQGDGDEQTGPQQQPPARPHRVQLAQSRGCKIAPTRQ